MVNLLNHESGLTMAQLGEIKISNLSMNNIYKLPFKYEKEHEN